MEVNRCSYLFSSLKMAGPDLYYSCSLSLVIASWLQGGCCTLNITSRFKAERKGAGRNKPTCVCFSSEEHSHKPHQQLQFSTFWPELCIVANWGSVRKEASENTYLLGNQHGSTQSLPYASWQYEFPTEKYCIKHSLPPPFFF